MTFRIQRSAPFTQPASVRFATSAVSAHATSDFATRTGAVTFAGGQSGSLSRCRS